MAKKSRPAKKAELYRKELQNGLSCKEIAVKYGISVQAVYDIVGTMLYMLWNDCCGRDTRQAMTVMKKCDPDEIRRHINYEGGKGIPFTPEELEEMNK